MTPPLTSALRPSGDDVVAFEVAHHLRQPEQRASARLRRFGAPALGAALVAALPLLGVRGLGPLSAIAAGLGLLWALAWPWAERALIARRLRALGAGSRGGPPPLALRWDGASLEVEVLPGEAPGGAPPRGGAPGPTTRLGLTTLGPAVIDGPRLYIYTDQHAALIFPAGQGEPVRGAVLAALRARADGPRR